MFRFLILRSGVFALVFSRLDWIWKTVLGILISVMVTHFKVLFALLLKFVYRTQLMLQDLYSSFYQPKSFFFNLNPLNFQHLVPVINFHASRSLFDFSKSPYHLAHTLLNPRMLLIQFTLCDHECWELLQLTL